MHEQYLFLKHELLIQIRSSCLVFDNRCDSLGFKSAMRDHDWNRIRLKCEQALITDFPDENISNITIQRSHFPAIKKHRKYAVFNWNKKLLPSSLPLGGCDCYILLSISGFKKSYSSPSLLVPLLRVKQVRVVRPSDVSECEIDSGYDSPIERQGQQDSPTECYAVVVKKV